MWLQNVRRQFLGQGLKSVVGANAVVRWEPSNPCDGYTEGQVLRSTQTAEEQFVEGKSNWKQRRGEKKRLTRVEKR